MSNQALNPKVKIIGYALAGVLIFLPGLYLIRFSILGIPTTVLEIGIYLLFILNFLLFSSGQERFYLPDRRWLWPIGLFIIGGVLGVFVSPDKRVALGQLKGFVFDPILLALIIFNFYFSIFNKFSSLKFKILNYLILSGVWLSILAIIQKLFGFGMVDGRALSIYVYDVNPSANYLALYLSPLAAMAVVLGIFNFHFSIFNKFSSLKSPIFNIISGILMIIAIFFSGSRGGLLGVGVGLLVGLIILAKARWLKILLTSLTFLIFLTTLWLTKPNLSVSPDSGRVASSNNIRYEIWTTTKEILTKNTKNFLFGVGLGNYQNHFTELTQGRVNYPEFIAPRALTPHNIFLAMWMNGGLLMLVGFVWILVIYFRSVLKLGVENPNNKIQMSNKIQNSNDKNLTLGHSSVVGSPRFVGEAGHSVFEIRHFNIVLTVAMVALLTHGLVDTPYFKNDLSLEFWSLVALITITNGAIKAE